MHVMLDYETIGNGADTMTLSLGAVCFNKSGIIGEQEFKFSLLDQVKSGRTFTASTLQWWMRQKEEARAVFQPSDFDLGIQEFFSKFEGFIEENLKKIDERWDEVKPWGNGANFDVSILEDTYRRHHHMRDEGIKWKHWNVMCFRTFNTLTDCKRLVGRPHGTYHTALGDARYQANCVLAYWKHIALKKKRKAARK